MTKLKLILLILTLSITMAATTNAATGMTAEQLRAEIARLTQVADTIRAKLAQLGAISQPITSTTCLNTNLRMQRNDSGESVSRLQRFLVSEGVYSPSLVTGYFGPATQTGVQKWQSAHGVVSYGTPSSTGFGRVGPSTLRAMHRGCIGGVYTGYNGTLNSLTTKPAHSSSPKILSIEKYSLSINPTVGTAPTPVTAKFSIDGSTCTSYILDWGDGTRAVSYNSGTSRSCDFKAIKIDRTHIYQYPGYYKVKFKTGKGPASNIQTVNTLDVEVR